jgi:hypothetical protein
MEQGVVEREDANYQNNEKGVRQSVLRYNAKSTIHKRNLDKLYFMNIKLSFRIHNLKIKISLVRCCISVVPATFGRLRQEDHSGLRVCQKFKTLAFGT